jgi:L-ribulose-5-phosphate 4-epimerase
MPDRYTSLREECCAANRTLPAAGLVDLTFGNVSVLDPAAGIIAIKPSGVPYDRLTPDDMVLIDLDGKVVQGALQASSDAPTHRCLLRAFATRGIRSIVHTHSRCAVAFAQAGTAIPCLGTTHADHCMGPVPVTRWLTPAETESAYEWHTGTAILECLGDADPAAVPAVLVRAHGPFAWGASGHDALHNARAVEICADLALKTLLLNAAAAPIPEVLMRRHYLRKHGATATYGQDATGG